ncbi:putative nuclease HARBI1 [Hydractinia symbiolongicarpus]|uniref:putative nuclease HARBI1 n=1 Tax=Hydractinia symbiolongicarpus TaxID=13093 RepID=UPI00254D15C4|nr:putative nuclease HARBI1 [Hydractinia symbiolongicarpus]
MSFISCRHEMKTILKYMLNYELSSHRFILNMASNKRQLALFSALNAVLVSSSTLLQLLSILVLKFLQEQRRLNNLRYQAVMERNTALSRYRRARLRYVRSKRKCWIKPGRTDKWWDNLHIVGNMCDDTWLQNFRMTKQQFMKLVELIRPYAKERSSQVRKDVIPLEKRLAITLYYLKDQGSLLMIGNTFGIAKSTTSVVVHEICGILAKDIASLLIKFPVEKADVEKISSNFLKRFGFPQVIGCVDGTHIPIKQPSENSHDYFSYKMYYSINCQAICDANGQFTNVEIKWPGSVHDARVFANCTVQEKYLNGEFKLFYKEIVEDGESVPQLLLGDPAYPLLPHVMKEFDHCISNEQVIFNQMLRSARNQIECAFGRLKARWRILNHAMDLQVKHVPNAILACFALHNFCEIEKSFVDPKVVEELALKDRSLVNTVDKLNSYTTTSGTRVRDTLANYFKEFL